MKNKKYYIAYGSNLSVEQMAQTGVRMQKL